jgi:CHAT domain-containing protein
MWRLNLAQAVENLTQIYSESNRKEEAEKVFNDAIKSYEDAFGENNFYNMSHYANFGDFHRKNGKYMKAEKYYLKALKSQKESLDEASAAGSGFEQAISALVAISELTKSMSGGQKSQDSLYVGGKVINNLAFVYRKLGQQDKIKSLYHNDFQYLQEKFSAKKLKYDFGSIHPLLIPIINNFANLVGNTDHKFSHELFVKAAELNNKMAESTFKTFFADDWKANFFRNSRIYAYNFLSHTAQYMQSEDSAIKDTFNMWANYKGSVVDFQSRLLYAVKVSDDSKVRRKFKEYKKVNMQLSKMSLASGNVSADEYVNLKAQKMNLEIELSRLLAPYLKNEDIEIEKIIDALPKNTAYIDFAKINIFDFQNQKFGEEKYFAFVILPDKNLSIKLIEIGVAKDIDKLVSDYHNTLELLIASKDPSRSITIVKKESIETGIDSYSEKLKQIGISLYEIILKPLESYMSDRKRLIISPDGELNLIPFEVFVKSNGKYVVEEYTINYITNVKDLLKYKEGLKLNETAVIIADPDYDFRLDVKDSEDNYKAIVSDGLSVDMRSLKFDRLSDTKDEANNIEKILKEKMKMTVKNFQDKKATEDVLLSVKSPGILHIATHGYFLKDLKIELKMSY